MRSLITAAALASLTISALSARAAVLYDGSLGTSPTAQNLAYGSLPVTNYFATAAGATTLDTSASDSIYAGFTATGGPVLNRATGFTVRVDAQLLSSAGSSTSRAGFSIIALSSDKTGIEIGFHGNEAFTQEGGTAPDLFTRAESASIDTLTAAHRYEVTILGSFYSLHVDGGPAILSGGVRDYTAFAGPINPYSNPNFIFIGDDTTSARGSTKFSFVSVTLPEPTALCALAFSSLVLRRRRSA